MIFLVASRIYVTYCVRRFLRSKQDENWVGLVTRRKSNSLSLSLSSPPGARQKTAELMNIHRGLRVRAGTPLADPSFVLFFFTRHLARARALSTGICRFYAAAPVRSHTHIHTHIRNKYYSECPSLRFCKLHMHLC